MIEYEAKFKIKNKKGIISRLKKLKAGDLGIRKEVDIYLSQGTRSVRLRKTGKSGMITSKNPVKEKVNAKVRNEIQSEVSDIGSLIRIFKGLGFNETKRKEKIRHTFKMKDVFVLVDRVPFLGNFIEIEGTSVRALKNAAVKLGFDYRTASFASYEDLFLAYYIKNAGLFSGVKTKVIPTFASEKKFKHGNQKFKKRF